MCWGSGPAGLALTRGGDGGGLGLCLCLGLCLRLRVCAAAGGEECVCMRGCVCGDFWGRGFGPP